MSGLPGTPPSFDWSHWSGLENLLKQRSRVVRTLTDPILPQGALASFWHSFGTLSYPAGTGGATATTTATIGQKAGPQAYDTVAAAAMQANSPTFFTALALTLEGFRIAQTSGFDAQFGFPPVGGADGGCYLYQPNGQTNAEVRTLSNTGSLSKTPRTVTDLVISGGNLSQATSATAAFTANDVGTPLSGLHGQGVIVPGTVVASVVNSTTITLSIPAIKAFTNATVSIGPSTNVSFFSAAVWQNFTYVWFPLDKCAWIMSDDQVLSEFNLANTINYYTGNPVNVQALITAETNAAYAMSWHQAKLTFAHN